MADPQNPVNTINLAFKGQKVDIDNYPEKKGLPKVRDIQEKNKMLIRNIDYEPDLTVDLSDLNNLNIEINGLRLRIHQARKDYKLAKRVATLAKYTYEQEKKRTWIQLSGGSEKTREAMAEIMCQDTYTEFLVAQTIADELKDFSATLRTELDALKELSNNQRRQIDLM